LLILFLIVFRVQKGVVAKFGDFYLANTRAREIVSFRKETRREINKNGQNYRLYPQSYLFVVVFFFRVFIFELVGGIS